MFFLIKMFFLFLFVMFIHRLFLAYKLMKKIRDEVLVKGKSQSRYYGVNGKIFESSQNDEEGVSSTTSASSDNVVEAEYRVIK